MDEQLGYKVWLPLVVTMVAWIGLVFSIAALVSNMWADLIGLFYLMFSPFIYRGLKAGWGESPSGNEATLDQSARQNIG